MKHSLLPTTEELMQEGAICGHCGVNFEAKEEVFLQYTNKGDNPKRKINKNREPFGLPILCCTCYKIRDKRT